MVVCSREYRGSTYLLREAVPSDCRLLYDWRMDPVTRAGSFGHNVFPYEEHEKWFRKLMADPCRKQFILLRLPAGVATGGIRAVEQPCAGRTAADAAGTAQSSAAAPAAQLRLDLTGQEAEISYSVAASERGKGIGTLLIRMAVSYAGNLSGIRALTAEVLPDNTASRRIFEKCGFHLLSEEPGRLLYICKLKGDTDG
ncbi:MAG: GNAT family N-acetyltransferase [Firmicutes bacterium]|nr:GNAT family N-acetyltransferase [Bacillota bacterium]